MRRTHRRSRADGANWLNFSDLMSSLLLIFILIMFYIMYQYFDMYEINMAEIARQQYDLDQANADLNEKTAKLSEAEAQMVAQQIRLNAAQKDLEDAESVLARQQGELSAAQTLLNEKEQQIAAQKSELDALSVTLGEQQEKLNLQQATLTQQQTKLDEQQATLTQQQTRLDEQQVTLDAQRSTLAQQQQTMDQQQQTMDSQRERLAQQQITMDAQQMKLDEQQQTLENQQIQIEQLVGLRTRIIASLSGALRAANISAQVDPSNGSIALKSDVLFAFGKSDLTDEGKRFIDEFLPVYLNVLLDDDYQENVTEIIIEGHTDSAGEYLKNLQLSQQRALAVANYVLADGYHSIPEQQKQRLRKLLSTNGRSFSDPVLYADGTENADASRRVVFKFLMTDEQMIQNLKQILEKDQ